MPRSVVFVVGTGTVVEFALRHTCTAARGNTGVNNGD